MMKAWQTAVIQERETRT